MAADHPKNKVPKNEPLPKNEVPKNERRIKKQNYFLQQQEKKKRVEAIYGLTDNDLEYISERTHCELQNYCLGQY
jgi:hypothetical protein